MVSFFLKSADVVLHGELTGSPYLAPHGRIYDAFGLGVAMAGYGLFAAVSMLSILAGLWLWTISPAPAIGGPSEAPPARPPPPDARRAVPRNRRRGEY